MKGENAIPIQGNAVIHKNSDGSYMCYIDGMFGACVTVSQIDDAIPALLEKMKLQIDYFKELDIPPIIGSDILPQEDQAVFQIDIIDNEAFKIIAEEALAHNKTMNAVVCNLIAEYIKNTKNNE